MNTMHDPAALQAAEKRERCWRVLVWARYLLPLVTALVLLISGSFYHVFALQSGKSIRVSVLRLCFNTLKSARAYLLSENGVAGVRNFYLFLMIGAILLLLFFVIALLLALFALYALRRATVARAAQDVEEEKHAKILLRAFLPNRVVMALVNALLLPLAFYPEVFSLICGQSLTVSGGITLYVRLNVTALVVSLLTLATFALAFVIRRRERALGLDMFDIEAKEDAEEEDGLVTAQENETEE
ncbi:MAG: hypothetical protein IJW51_04645 [Clostridia bacterium]|nr:hypothetical protein [Clostridia bacterium]